MANFLVTFNMRPSLYNYGTVKLTGEWVKVSDSLYSLDSNFLAEGKKTNTYLTLYADYAMIPATARPIP